MLKRAFRGPETAGFLVLGATAGAVLAGFAGLGGAALWLAGAVGAAVLPVALKADWARLASRSERRDPPGRVSA